MSWQCNGCGADIGKCTCSLQSGHAEWIEQQKEITRLEKENMALKSERDAARGEVDDLRIALQEYAKDAHEAAMHPTGRCVCGGEGKCLWCMYDFAREESVGLESKCNELRKRCGELEKQLRLYVTQCAECKAEILPLDGPPTCDNCYLSDESEEEWEDARESLEQGAGGDDD
jgi:predicted nuclease with TOPRIM domain